MIVYVVLKYKEGQLKGVETYKTLSEAGKVHDRYNDYQCVIKRTVIQ